MDESFVRFAVILSLAFVVETTAGFGSVLVALGLGAHFYPITGLLPVVLPLNIVLASYIMLRHGGHADKRFLIRTIGPVMGVGLFIGQLVYRGVSESTLKMWLGVVILGLSCWQLTRLFGKKDTTPMASAPRVLTLLLAGVIHGMYATGGPFVVYVLSRTQLNKSQLRSTLTMLWLTINLVLVTLFIVDGSLDAAKGTRVLTLLPVLALSVALGEWLHHRIDEISFRKVVYVLLIGAGISLFASGLAKG